MTSPLQLYDYAMHLLGAHYATSRIGSMIAGMPEYNKDLAFHICKTLFELGNSDLEQFKKTTQNLIRMSEEFLDLQGQLEIKGHYKYSSFEEVKENIIDNASVMEGGYLDALFLSQAFWPNHNRILSFFIEDFCRNTDRMGKVLEVPCGSGVFSLEFLRRNPWDASLCDLSRYSVHFSKSVLDHFHIENAQYIHGNVFDLDDHEAYDRIICGELLEHLENPEQLLDKLHSLLKADGLIFLTTAVWAAAIDHLYLFKSAREVDEMLTKRFDILRQRVLPLNPNEDPHRERIPINYAAILKKR